MFGNEQKINVNVALKRFRKFCISSFLKKFHKKQIPLTIILKSVIILYRYLEMTGMRVSVNKSYL